MARNRCSVCQFIEQHCLCNLVERLDNQTLVTLLQHPKEATHAKNTGRLLPLVLNNLIIAVGETPDDFSEVSQRTTHQRLVLFPNPASEELSALPASFQTSVTASVATTGANSHGDIKLELIVIDATWRKAKKIYAINPWLHALPSIHLNPAKSSNYQIRKSSLPYSLSTIECVKTCMSMIEGLPSEPFDILFKQFKQNYLKYLPHSLSAAE
ncbi:MAG: tRNA-uridine aminocarboxypropyltransferase [Kangiellaceae bacterium]|jgi:DTW domain-containing protein YfiP|nr:tRNA-uridine aminocarboxypropyltransferase [Kangiellaceae bacterium]